jgi:hypothetical protein
MVRLTVYLDTSSWNHLLGGQMSSMGKVIGKSASCIPCYSIQTVEELLGARSEKKKAELDLQLDAVGARYLETLSDTVGGMPTDYRISVKSREERCQIYEGMQNLSSIGGFGLGDFLQKSIGGIGSTSFEDISKAALTDIERLLNIDVSEFPPEMVAIVTSAAEAMKKQAREVHDELLDQLNRLDDICLPQLNPTQINNFIGTRAFERIIEVARSEEGTSAMVEQFLGQPHPIPSKRADAHLCTPTWEQVNRLAQLRKDSERARIDFVGGQADILHIANASFCSLFHTSDKPQAHLAAAVYDHLNIQTVVLLYTPKTDIETMLYVPKSMQAIDE